MVDSDEKKQQIEAEFQQDEENGGPRNRGLLFTSRSLRSESGGNEIPCLHSWYAAYN
jgi:hypothetical protein